jgi:hypothetical protein
MAEHAHSRSTDPVNDLIIRVSILENNHIGLVQIKDEHSALLDKLVDQDNKAIIALNNINLKFDALIHQFSVGFKIVMICGAIVTTSVTAFWVYNADLNARFSTKMDSIASNTAIQRELINTTSEDVNHIKQLKAVKGSK